MSASPSTYQANLSRREEMAVSGAAMSNAPWKLAGATGVIVTAADIVAHLIFFHLEFLNPVALGVAAFFAVAGAGALVRSRNSRAVRWARSRPWRFAVMPGAAAAIVVFVLAVVTGSSIAGGVLDAVWHGALAFGATGLVGSVVRPRGDERA